MRTMHRLLQRCLPGHLGLCAFALLLLAMVGVSPGYSTVPWVLLDPGPSSLDGHPVLAGQSQIQLDASRYREHASAPWEAAIGINYYAGQPVPNPTSIPALNGRTFWNIWGKGTSGDVITRNTALNEPNMTDAAGNCIVYQLISSTEGTHNHRSDYEQLEETELQWVYGTSPGTISILGDSSPGSHTDNCLADFMKTSESSLNLAYGQTQMSGISDISNNRVLSGISSYLAWRKPYVGNYTAAFTPTAFDYQSGWPSFMATIAAGKPALVFASCNPANTTAPDTVLLAWGYWYDFTDLPPLIKVAEVNFQNATSPPYYTPEPNVTQASYPISPKTGIRYYQLFYWTPLAISLTPSFTDVPTNDGNWETIEACADYRTGIVGGYGDGTYRPTLTVTRDAMAVYIARAVAEGPGDESITDPPATASFPDVPTTHWAYKYGEYCYSQGIVGGYADGTYRPTLTVNRDAMAVFVSRAVPEVTGAPGAYKTVGDAYFQNPSNYPPPTTATFNDVPTGYWAYKYIEYLKAYYANSAPAGRRYGAQTLGFWDGTYWTYQPLQPVDRGTMAAFIWKAWEYPRE